MTNDQIAALVAAAKKATPGPWECNQTIIQGKAYGGKWIERSDGEGVKVSGSGGAVSYTGAVFAEQAHDDNDANATFVAAANPAAILSLVERLREAEYLLKRAHTILSNMAQENERAVFNRWPINHEPLRADAKALAPLLAEHLEKHDVK